MVGRQNNRQQRILNRLSVVQEEHSEDGSSHIASLPNRAAANAINSRDHRMSGIEREYYEEVKDPIIEHNEDESFEEEEKKASSSPSLSLSHISDNSDREAVPNEIARDQLSKRQNWLM